MEDNTSGTVTIWHSGRLAPRVAAAALRVHARARCSCSALLVLSAAGAVDAFVAVLEKDVGSGELAALRCSARARTAEAQCEADQPAQLRGRCIALLNGDELAVGA